MARTKHKPRAAAAAVSRIALQDAEPLIDLQAYQGAGITAADYSEARGFIYFPNMKGVDQFRGYSRTETIRRCQWLVWNMGPARVLHKLARWVGAVGITPATADREWNKLAAAWWRQKFERSRQSYALTGRHTVSEYLVNATFLTLRDGDALAVRGRDERGAPVAGIYESLLCCGGGDGFSDGVRLSPHHRHLAYSVRHGTEGKDTVLPAEHCHLFGNGETHASVRGTPALVHAVNRLLDFREIDAATLQILKVHQMFGLAFTREMGAATTPIRPVSGGGRKVPVPADRAGSSEPGAATAATRRFINDVMGTGGEILDNLPPGVKIDKLTDGRDFPAETAVKSDIYAQLSLGLGIPIELLFMLDKLTGPGIRFVMRQGQQWREWWLDQQISWLVPDYAMRLEHAIRSKELPPCKGDPFYWRHEIRYPAAITIDDGRDARSQIAKLQAGLTTEEECYGEQGSDWREMAEQRVEELRYKLDLLNSAGVPPELFFTQLRPDLAADAAPEQPAAA